MLTFANSRIIIVYCNKIILNLECLQNIIFYQTIKSICIAKIRVCLLVVSVCTKACVWLQVSTVTLTAST